MKYFRSALKEYNDNQHDDGMKNMLGGGRVKRYVDAGSNLQSAYAVAPESGSYGGCYCEDMEGGKKKGGKTAKFFRSVGHFVKPMAPLVKKTKKALAPLAEQALQQAAMEMAMSGAGKKKGGKTAKFLRSVGHFVKPAAPLVKKVKRALAPLAEQALQQGAMEMAMGAGRKPRMIGGARQPSPWIQHVKAVAAQHGISYKEAMSKAKETYRK